MNPTGTPANLIPGDSNPLCADDRDLIAAAYARGDKLRAIRDATGRSMGTIKSEVRRLRAAGLVGYRYAGCADARP